MQSTAGALVGHSLGHYALTALLGVGGMAEVYRAHDTRLPREVAVKVLPPTLAADPAYVARFRSEARRVAALRHPHIVPVYEFGEHEGLLYLVMPLEPESLRDRLLRRGPLPIADALAVAIQVASALEAAHAQGIVHRDVKPENILLDQAGHALLTDFGIARELAFLRRAGAVQTLAATGLPVGTPEYMAPEQLRNGPIDQRADVYALGAVLYELLCGVAPHEAGTPYEVAALALTESITPPSRHNPKVWPDLEAAVLTALSPHSADRYASVADFAAALRAASKPGTKSGGGIRATLPIFRKTATVDPYEGPTREVLIYGTTGVPSLRGGRFRGRGNGGGGAGTVAVRDPRSRGRRLFSIVAALMLAAAVAVGALAILRTIETPGSANGLLPPVLSGATATVTSASSSSTAPTATGDPAASASPSAITSPTATLTPTATPLPQPTLSIQPGNWVLHPNSRNTACVPGSLANDQTITNAGQNPISWQWTTFSPLLPASNFHFYWREFVNGRYNGWSTDLPNGSSLAPGASVILDLQMPCTPAQQYTVAVLIYDPTFNTSRTETFVLVDPGT